MEPTQANPGRRDERAPPVAGTLGQVVRAGRSNGNPIPVAVVVSIFDDLLAGDVDPPAERPPDLDDVLIDQAGVARMDVATDLDAVGRLLAETLGDDVPAAARQLVGRLKDGEPAEKPADAAQLRDWIRSALGQPADRAEVVALVMSVASPLPVPEPVSSDDEALHDLETIPPNGALMAPLLGLGPSPQANIPTDPIRKRTIPVTLKVRDLPDTTDTQPERPASSVLPSPEPVEDASSSAEPEGGDTLAMAEGASSVDAPMGGSDPVASSDRSDGPSTEDPGLAASIAAVDETAAVEVPDQSETHDSAVAADSFGSPGFAESSDAGVSAFAESVVSGEAAVPGQVVSGETAVPGQVVSGEAAVPGQVVSGEAAVPGQVVSGEAAVPGQVVSGEAAVPGQVVSGEAAVPGLVSSAFAGVEAGEDAVAAESEGMASPPSDDAEIPKPAVEDPFFSTGQAESASREASDDAFDVEEPATVAMTPQVAAEVIAAAVRPSSSSDDDPEASSSDVDAMAAPSSDDELAAPPTVYDSAPPFGLAPLEAGTFAESDEASDVPVPSAVPADALQPVSSVDDAASFAENVVGSDDDAFSLQGERVGDPILGPALDPVADETSLVPEVSREAEGSSASADAMPASASPNPVDTGFESKLVEALTSGDAGEQAQASPDRNGSDASDPALSEGPTDQTPVVSAKVLTDTVTDDVQAVTDDVLPPRDQTIVDIRTDDTVMDPGLDPSFLEGESDAPTLTMARPPVAPSDLPKVLPRMPSPARSPLVVGPESGVTHSGEAILPGPPPGESEDETTAPDRPLSKTATRPAASSHRPLSSSDNRPLSSSSNRPLARPVSSSGQPTLAGRALSRGPESGRGNRPVVRHQVRRDNRISVPVAPAARRTARQTRARDSIMGPSERSFPWGWFVVVGMVAGAAYYLLFT